MSVLKKFAVVVGAAIITVVAMVSAILLSLIGVAIGAAIGYGIVYAVNILAGYTVISPWIGAIVGALLALVS